MAEEKARRRLHPRYGGVVIQCAADGKILYVRPDYYEWFKSKDEGKRARAKGGGGK